MCLESTLEVGDVRSHVDGKGGAGFLKVSRGDPGDGSVQLYDLSVDPGERKNVADEHPEVVKRLKRKLDQQ